jgi:hypothetical protein
MPTESNLIIAADHNFKVLRGDNPSCALTFLDALNAPIDFTGATIKMQARWKLTDVEVVKEWTLGSGLAVSGAGNNIVTVTGFDTLRAGQLYYDMQFTFLSGEKITYLRGLIIVLEDATR